jgi:hypothetical protein
MRKYLFIGVRYWFFEFVIRYSLSRSAFPNYAKALLGAAGTERDSYGNLIFTP